MASSVYWNEWQALLKEREAIAHYNPYKAVKTMKGIAMEKYHAMEHRYPTKAHLIDTYGYEGIIARDNYKNQWCEKNNIPLIRIPYTDYNNIDGNYMENIIHHNGWRLVL